MNNDTGDFIFHKIKSLSKTKKFLGITREQVKGLAKKAPAQDVELGIEELIAARKLSEKTGYLFPADWKPRFSRMEQEIVSFISPCFENLIVLRPGKVLGEFALFNEASFEKLLLKLELEGKVIKLDTLLYIDKSIYDSSLEICKELEKFSIKEFCTRTKFKRDNAFILLKAYEKSRFIRLSDSSWNFISDSEDC